MPLRRQPENPNAYRGAFGIPQPAAGQPGGGFRGFFDRAWRGGVRAAIPDHNVRGYGSLLTGGPASAVTRGLAGGVIAAFRGIGGDRNFEDQSNSMAMRMLGHQRQQQALLPNQSDPVFSGLTPFIMRSNQMPNYSGFNPGYLSPGLAGPDQQFAGPPAAQNAPLYGQGTGMMRDPTQPSQGGVGPRGGSNLGRFDGLRSGGTGGIAAGVAMANSGMGQGGGGNPWYSNMNMVTGTRLRAS